MVVNFNSLTHSLFSLFNRKVKGRISFAFLKKKRDQWVAFDSSCMFFSFKSWLPCLHPCFFLFLPLVPVDSLLNKGSWVASAENMLCVHHHRLFCEESKERSSVCFACRTNQRMNWMQGKIAWTTTRNYILSFNTQYESEQIDMKRKINVCNQFLFRVSIIIMQD